MCVFTCVFIYKALCITCFALFKHCITWCNVNIDSFHICASSFPPLFYCTGDVAGAVAIEVSAERGNKIVNIRSTTSVMNELKKTNVFMNYELNGVSEIAEVLPGDRFYFPVSAVLTSTFSFRPDKDVRRASYFNFENNVTSSTAISFFCTFKHMDGTHGVCG